MQEMFALDSPKRANASLSSPGLVIVLTRVSDSRIPPSLPLPNFQGLLFP